MSRESIAPEEFTAVIQLLHEKNKDLEIAIQIEINIKNNLYAFLLERELMSEFMTFVGGHDNQSSKEAFDRAIAKFIREL